MRWALGAALVASVVIAGTCYVKFAPAQTASLIVRPLTVPDPPSNTAIPPDMIYPDAVVCNITSPEGIEYRVIFYKSQTISFGNEPNNAAEYGTPFLRDNDKFGATTSYKWRLQLGRPGTITVFAFPSGWTTNNCPLGKSIRELIADKQALRIFTPQ